MRTLLLAFACLAHHAHARRLPTRNEDRDAYTAIAAFLLANPLLSREALRTGEQLRTRVPMMQMVPFESTADWRSDRLAPIPIRDPNPAPVVPRPRDPPSKWGPIRVQGQTRKTCHYESPGVHRAQVVLTTEGRPMDADVELFEGPDNNPVRIRAYSEDGLKRPFSTIIETPRAPCTLDIKNIGQLEHPLNAYIISNDVDEPVSDFDATSIIVQGTALRTWAFGADVESVEVMLKTDSRPLNARIELLQGPNTNKQIIEVYTEHGIDRPFVAIIETIGNDNTVRLVNTGPLEFPIMASVQPRAVTNRNS